MSSSERPKRVRETLISCLVVSTALTALSAADTYDDFENAQDIIRAVADAYGGVDALNGLNRTSFETDSTYYAFHQSMGVSERWDPQDQTRHYAIDLDRGAAAFGRNMDEWSFHNIYTPDASKVIDRERRVVTSTVGASAASYAHVVDVIPALIAKHLVQHPYGARFRAYREDDGKRLARVDFVDHRGGSAAVFVDVATGLIEELELVSNVPPFGDVRRVIRYDGYESVQGIMTPRVVRTGIGSDVEFEHRLKNVRINEPIDRFLVTPDNLEEIPRPDAHEWRVDEVAPNVHLATNGSYNVPIVEFAHHLIAYNASRRYDEIDDAIDAVESAFPAKPLKYALLSHHHFDRAGSAGAYVRRGVVLMAARKYEERIRSFVEGRKLVAAHRPAEPALEPEFVFVEDGTRFSDGSQAMRVLHVPGNSEAETLFVLYVERSRVLIHEGDLFRKYRQGPLRSRRRGSVALARFIDASGLDVELLVGNRGAPATLDDLHATNAGPPFR